MNKQDFCLIYLFLALGGRVTVREHNLFSSIMKHEGYDDADIKEVGRNTMSIIASAYSDNDREAIIRHQFEKYSQDNTKKGNTVHNRTLLWTLINLGFSDSSYSKAEQRLVHLFAKNMNLGKSYVLEMEDTAKALLSVQQEKEFLDSLEQSGKRNKIYTELELTRKSLHKQISTLVQLG